ncbi:MAG TPA: carbohydrate ABC transporter permease [Spirochaetia bacterium]|nr:carbohydrate ABC transporter permease [Spirochaetia bacterium]
MRRASLHDLPIHFFLVLFGIITFYPFVFTILTSFKTSYQISHNFWGLPTSAELSNYRDAWTRLYPYLLNSLIVTSATVVGVLFVSSLAAYVFARFDFPGREFLFILIICLLMIPSILLLVPQFLMVKSLRLLNTRWALILPYIAGGQVFAIFILRSFMEAIPNELFDAGSIDGLSTVGAYRHIAIPMSIPVLSTVAILNILGTWNDYVWPLVTISKTFLWTISVGIASFAQRTGSFETRGVMFAGYVIASAPLVILFFFTMRSFIKGISSGALKV